MFGFLIREVVKAVAISAGVEVVRTKVIVPVTEKIKKKIDKMKKDIDDKNDNKPKNSQKVYDAEWE